MKRIVDRLKQGNPNIRVFAQVVTTAERGTTVLTAEQITAYIRAVFLHSRPILRTVFPRMVIKSYTFEAEPVLMDYHDFRHCVFKKCRLIFCGYSAVKLDNCRFDDCRWEFSGPAMATLQLLANLHQGGSEMGRMIVQQAISVITHPPPGLAQPSATSPAAADTTPKPSAAKPPTTSAPTPPPAAGT